MTKITKNQAGGKAYQLSDKATLAQLVLTGTLNQNCSLGTNTDTERIIELCKSVDDAFVGKLAFYARKFGLMKDTPVLLVGYLACYGEPTVFHRTFDVVIDNAQQVRKFVNIMRSGMLGRKSLGSGPKRAVQRWFDAQTPERLYWQSIGQNPSLGDVIKLAHPRPNGEAKNAMFAHLIGKELPEEYMPERVKNFFDFKKDMTLPVPNVPFMRLTALPLTKDHWKQIASRMTWNQLRQNINTLERHGVFEDAELTEMLAYKLADPEQTPNHVLPFALRSTVEHISTSVPRIIHNAAQVAMENSLSNTPVFDHDVIVAVDISGSMNSPVTGSRSQRSSLNCAEAAAFFAAGLFKANPGRVKLIRFNHDAYWFDGAGSLRQIMANLSRTEGGTRTSSCIQLANASEETAPLFIILSDNMSWISDSRVRQLDSYGYAHRFARGSKTDSMEEWNKYQQRVGGNAKLVCWNVQPYETSQTPDREDILNVGGFTDSVFQIIKYFDEFENAEHWVGVIESQEL